MHPARLLTTALLLVALAAAPAHAGSSRTRYSGLGASSVGFHNGYLILDAPVRPTRAQMIVDRRFAMRIAAAEADRRAFLRSQPGVTFVDRWVAPAPEVSNHYMAWNWLPVIAPGSPRHWKRERIEGDQGEFHGEQLARHVQLYVKPFRHYELELPLFRWGTPPQLPVRIANIIPTHVVGSETYLLLERDRISFLGRRGLIFDPSSEEHRGWLRDGEVIDPDMAMLDHEKLTASILVGEGHRLVAARNRTSSRAPEGRLEFVGNQMASDASFRIEFKRLQPGGTFKTVFNNLMNSGKRGGQSDILLLDLRQTDLTAWDALRGLRLLTDKMQRLWDVPQEPPNTPLQFNYREIRFVGKGFDDTYILMRREEGVLIEPQDWHPRPRPLEHAVL